MIIEKQKYTANVNPDTQIGVQILPPACHREKRKSIFKQPDFCICFGAYLPKPSTETVEQVVDSYAIHYHLAN